MHKKAEGFHPESGDIQDATNRCFSLISLSPPLHLPSSFSKINKHNLGWELKSNNNKMCHVPDNMVDGVFIFSSSYEKPPPGLIKVSVKLVCSVILLGVLDSVLRLSRLWLVMKTAACGFEPPSRWSCFFPADASHTLWAFSGAWSSVEISSAQCLFPRKAGQAQVCS